MATSISRNVNFQMNLKNNATKELQGFHGQIEKLQPAFRKMALVGTASFAAIAAGVGKTVQMAGRAEDISALFDLAFSDTEDRMNKFVDEFANEFGRARTSIRQMASDMGFALSMGTDLASDSIADMTEELVFAAEALALADARIDSGEQAMLAFADAMNGSMQQARRYIPTLREANVEQKALEMGLIDVGGELSQTQRAMALYELIMEGTVMSQQRLTEAEGDYTDTKMRLSAAIQDASEVLGEQFLPMVTDLLERIVPVITKMGEWVEENPKLTRNLIIAAAAVSALVAGIGLLGMAIFVLKPAIIGIGIVIGALSLPILLIIGLIGVIVATIAFLALNWREHWDTIKWATQQVTDKLTAIFKSAKERIMGFLQPIIDAAERAINLARRAKELAGGAISGARDRLQNFGAKITPFANGGIVTRPTLGMVGEAGPEAIIPLSKAGGMGLTININGGFFGTDAGEELGDQIIKQLRLSEKI